MNKKLLIAFVLIIIFFIYPVIALNADNKEKKSTDVRVQDNGWLRIVDHFIFTETMGDKIKESIDRLGIEENPDLFKDETPIKTLIVKIQFLKPCKATTLMDKISSEYEREKYITIMLYIIGESGESKINKEEHLKVRKKLEEMYPDLDEVMIGLLVPKFRCGDYRTMVFVTFYNSLGSEISTDKQLPFLYRDEREKNITEKLPGEITYLSFIIPRRATSWDIWLPK
jgi:hypothetical protein